MVHKKINYVLILPFLIVLGLSSCTKISKQDTTIEFVVRNPANGEPFVGVPVVIVENKRGDKGVTGEAIFRDVTNENGRASYTFKAKEGSRYWYYPAIDESYFGSQKDWRYCARPEVSSYAMKKDEYNEALYEIVYLGYLQERFVNENCEGPTDSVFIKLLPTVLEPGGLIRKFTLTGCFDRKTEGGHSGNPPGYFKIEMGLIVYEYRIKREGEDVIYGKDSVYVEPFVLNEIEIKF